MKKKFTFIAAMITSFAIYSANAQTPVTSQPQWPEKNEFHKVMAQTYHPSEEGNYEPIRSRIGEMHEKAVAWANSTPPKEFDKPEIKSAQKELVGQIVALKAMIENKATNEQLKPKMEELHNTFHKIVGLCSKDDSHEGHDHESHEGKEHKE
jgi:hypothetical protein